MKFVLIIAFPALLVLRFVDRMCVLMAPSRTELYDDVVDVTSLSALDVVETTVWLL